VRDLVRGCYAERTRRPAIDPVVFFRLQLVMFFEGIRCERALLRLAADRLSVRWHLVYTLDEALPDHASLIRIRTRYGLDVFRRHRGHRADVIRAHPPVAQRPPSVAQRVSGRQRWIRRLSGASATGVTALTPRTANPLANVKYIRTGCLRQRRERDE
jgi:hypothetical protein